MKKVVKRFWGFVLALVLVVACLSGFSMTPKLHAEDASMATSSSLSEEEMFEIISRANEVIGNSRGLPYNALLEEAISLLALIDTGVEKIEASGFKESDEYYFDIILYKLQVIAEVGTRREQFGGTYKKILTTEIVGEMPQNVWEETWVSHKKKWNAHGIAYDFFMEVAPDYQAAVDAAEEMKVMLDKGFLPDPMVSREEAYEEVNGYLNTAREKLGESPPPSTEPTLEPSAQPTLAPSPSPTITPPTPSPPTKILKPTKVTVKKKLTIKVGKKKTLKAKLSPKGISKAWAKLTWKSSKKKIATVNKKGIVTAKKKGSCKITVKTVNSKKAVCRVKVKK